MSYPNTDQLLEKIERLERELAAAPVTPRVESVLLMTPGTRGEWQVQICGADDRTFVVSKHDFEHRRRADFQVAALRYVLGRGPKPAGAEFPEYFPGMPGQPTPARPALPEVVEQLQLSHPALGEVVAERPAGPSGRVVLQNVFAVCEAIEDAADDKPGDTPEVERFKAGSRFAGKRIRNAVGNWFQDEVNAARAASGAAYQGRPASCDGRGKNLQCCNGPCQHQVEEARNLAGFVKVGEIVGWERRGFASIPQINWAQGHIPPVRTELWIENLQPTSDKCN
jgi:hypothetical protein